MPLGRSAAGQSYQTSFLLTIEPTTGGATGGPPVQSRFQAFLHKALADPLHTRRTDLQSLTDLSVGPAGPFGTDVRFEKNSGVDLLFGAGPTRIHQLLESRTLLGRKVHHVTLSHYRSSWRINEHLLQENIVLEIGVLAVTTY
jgi:hypothetical protein